MIRVDTFERVYFASQVAINEHEPDLLLLREVEGGNPVRLKTSSVAAIRVLTVGELQGMANRDRDPRPWDAGRATMGLGGRGDIATKAEAGERVR